MTKTAAILVAAGRGRRVGGSVPKQWRILNGRVVLAWTLDAFLNTPQIDEIVIVLHEDDLLMAAGYEGHDGVRVVAGGKKRTASVANGLEALAGDPPDRVLIHDGARPLIDPGSIASVIDALDTSPAAALALPVTDALWSGNEGHVDGIVPRDGLYRAQTPQGFHFNTILEIHRSNETDAADDVTLARNAGLSVAIVPGDERNLKITTEDDFARAAALMEDTMDIRTGTGFDVHAFAEGDHVMLCGLAIPHDKTLSGHSDADVALHTITDAIYGALAEGDIGTHFPPSDPMWKGAESRLFLEHALSRVAARGFEITHIDCTIICEKPKIGPHAEAMRAQLANLTGLGTDRLSVKATTSERLGFTGREEGIASLATVTLVSR